MGKRKKKMVEEKKAKKERGKVIKKKTILEIKKSCHFRTRVYILKIFVNVTVHIILEKPLLNSILMNLPSFFKTSRMQPFIFHNYI